MKVQRIPPGVRGALIAEQMKPAELNQLIKDVRRMCECGLVRLNEHGLSKDGERGAKGQIVRATRLLRAVPVLVRLNAHLLSELDNARKSRRPR